MSREDDTDKPALLAHTASIVSAYLGSHQIDTEALPDLIKTVYQGLAKADGTDDAPQETRPDPAVPITESLRDDVIICLEDGLPFQSLKRHLRVKYNLTPDAYRKKWGLPPDYPMVAPDYAKRRSALAKRSGLGKNKR